VTVATGIPMTATPVLRLHNITKRFGPLVANDAISLELRRGEVVALLGENGAGKTTLMNILFGHYVADEGTVEATRRSQTSPSVNASAWKFSRRFIATRAC
jgi:simple sugar transport system ATP-binding protein